MSALTRNETRRRLQAFAKQWENTTREHADAKLFWARFYECFGIRPESATIYEKAVQKIDGATGYIDSFIPGKLIVEHKSRGRDFTKAFTQASDYYTGLKELERPRYIIISDFARFELTDLRTNTVHTCGLAELPQRADWFSFLIEGDEREILEESPINREAAYQISKLHEALLRVKFKGKDLEIFLTRLLFCLFADDTGIFGENNLFRRIVEASREDGRDLGARLADLFQVLDTPRLDRQSNLDEALAVFEYINGSLFSRNGRIPAFDYDLRRQLIACVELDWSGISPAIFGSMFQGVLEEHDPDAENRKGTRRELGAHFTSERNILRVINPLFMDSLRTDLANAKSSKPRLQALYDKLPMLTFFDPACGCGNFLVIAFRELRRLENDVIEALWTKQKGLLDVSTLCRVKVSQFYGIEIDEAAAHIARVAMWITDHQMNLEAAERFGTTRPTVPLIDSPTIACANALRIDWTSILSSEKCSYIMGNPPFVGYSYQSKEQKGDLMLIFHKMHGAGVLDYVTAWYLKAIRYIKANPSITVAFVSTNSISQGEQPAVLWAELLKYGTQMHFAHRTFRWSNEGKGVAAVHCVIIGFGLQEGKQKRLFDYSDSIKGEPAETIVKRINPYLVDAPTVLLDKRRVPISADMPEMIKGSQPTDGGNLLLSAEEAAQIHNNDPIAAKYIRPFLGADEFINNIPRFCLWLKNSTAQDRNDSPELRKRIKAVQAMRLASPKLPTQKLARVAYLFGEIRQTDQPYLLIPSVSSEHRVYVPIGYFEPEVIASNLVFMLPNAMPYHFGILSSSMHNAWMRTTCGRLKSDYRYSNTIVYNNYPWPLNLNDKAKIRIENAAQAVLDARQAEESRSKANHSRSSLASMYATGAMPQELADAHQILDKAVDAAYGYKSGKDDASRVAYLFEQYLELTSLLPTERPKKRIRAHR
ncbi:type II restriction/modification system DNA methylase subunit YeeA [Nitrosospira sp. Nsp5]|uniref:site-specific DNA-methyltransferase (adenine-specific) n=1 Tax=Nitrosospira multiformis TaxID=1231 RepID=A0ABY0TNH8_9PROT|nr:MULTISPECIES: DNA methyltransferase [Nitrosospira]PTR05600.1 type II restriction/modification system DNA methylase subunit YeeA [Nitrosospira sp. Nsp5]SDR10889.1 Type II restriction/modification system, DNA methylase subunit YeeA [Nitrosospira multiformis]